MRQIMSVVDRLDIRRAQVLIEAILVEISTNSAAELGVNWAIGSQRRRQHGADRHIQSNRRQCEHRQHYRGAEDPDIFAEIGLPTGLTLGAGRFKTAASASLYCYAHCAATHRRTFCRHRRS